MEWEVMLPMAKVEGGELYEHSQGKPLDEWMIWRRPEPGQAPAAGEGGWQRWWGARGEAADGRWHR